MVCWIRDAVPRILEAYEIVMKLGRADAVAVIGMYVVVAKKQLDDARLVLQRSVDMYHKLGRQQEARGVDDLIRRLNLA